MTKAAISNLVGIKIEDSYPWKDSLFIASGVATFGESEYEKCQAKITVRKCNKLDTSGCRDIGDGLLIGNNIFVDARLGVRLERNGTTKVTLETNQECNEWLVICIQLMLVELGCTLVHAAALEKNGEVLLLPSWGGVGKTATVVRMVRQRGWRLLGDDLVILKGDEVLPFLKPFVIYPYHKGLFPEVFSANRGRIITNPFLNKTMSKLIPVARRTMRLVPGLLAFARKHNPQSMRISPEGIFRTEQLSHGGKLRRVVWLERTTENEVRYTEENVATVASKSISVSMMELFADRLSCLFALCGAGVFSYNRVQANMFDLFVGAYSGKGCYELGIPVSVPIDEVGNVVIEYLGCE